MASVIIPCAGLSSRYENTRPKYLLTLPNGQLFLEKAIEPYKDFDIHVAILKEHEEKYNVINSFNKVYKDTDYKINFHVLDKLTSGPAETVYEVVKKLDEQPFMVQDCDSFFTFDCLIDKNFIVSVDLNENKDLYNVANKSYIQINDQNIITNIVEKNIISNHFCAGGYGFKSSGAYISYYKELSDYGEVFVSHVIKAMIRDEHAFYWKRGHQYKDLGTYKEFVENSIKQTVYFVDIDGTLIKSQSSWFNDDYNMDYTPIEGAVKFLQNKIFEGATVIFTTARPEWARERTRQILDDMDFDDCQLIMALPHAPRILINDYHNTNPYPTAQAINVPRDSEDFWKHMK